VRIEPVRRYARPQLPTREIVDANPELLRLLPKRWQGNSAVLMAMVGTGLLLQCSGSVLAKGSVPLPGSPLPPQLILSESEARRIIVEEAKKAGIVFAADSRTLDIPLSSLCTEPKPRTEATTRITLDGTDAKLGVSYEYVSEKDTQALSARCGCTVSEETAAAAIRATGKAPPKGRLLVVSDISGFSRKEADGKIRTQVQDFIKWLKAQGVI
jgi:hypothetical protein